MEDQKLPLLSKPPPPPPLISKRLLFVTLLICLLNTFPTFDLCLQFPSYVEPFLAEPPIARITGLRSLSFNSSRDPDGTWRTTDRKVYRLIPKLSLPNPEGKTFAAEGKIKAFVRGCLYRNNTCVTRALPPVLFPDRESMFVTLTFEMDEEADLGGIVEESGRVPTFDIWVGAEHVVSEPGSWFLKTRVTKVVCKGVKAAYPDGYVGDGKQCEAKTWPVLSCRWCDIYRRWLYKLRRFRRGDGDCPAEPSLKSLSLFD